MTSSPRALDESSTVHEMPKQLGVSSSSHLVIMRDMLSTEQSTPLLVTT